MADPENKLTQVSSVESNDSTTSNESSKSEQNRDRIIAGRGVGGELRFNNDGLVVGGGEAFGAKITWEELLYLKNKTGAVTIGGGIGRGAELPGVKARIEEEKARDRAEKEGPDGK